MAVFATTISINQDAFTFYDLVEYFYDQGFQDDFNATGEYTISGHTFEAFVKDSYYVQFQIDEQIYSTAFISETDITIIYNESDLISVSGTINTIGTVDLEFGSPLYGITGINVDFADLFEVILTPTSSDDLSIIRDMLIGDDEFYLSDEADLARGFDGNDIMYGYSGDDTLDGGDGDDTIYGGDGDDNLTAGDGDDTLVGGEGDDDFHDDWSGDDHFDGGNGFDRLFTLDQGATSGAVIDVESGTITSRFYPPTWSDVPEQDEIDTFTSIEGFGGTDQDDTFLGSEVDEAFYGNGGNDSASGGAGDDVLIGGNGNDKSYGQAGNDSLYIDAGNDTLDGGIGTDWLYVTGSTNSVINLAKTTGQNTGYGTDIIKNIENASGGTGVDKFYGTGGNNTLKGNNGNDLLYGQNGNDRLYGGNNNDKLYGGNNNDKLYGGSGADKVYGQAGNDSLYMDAGNDTIDGGSGTDWLYVTGSTNSVVNLAKTTGQNTGYGTDIIKNIENASGGTGVDKFYGTTGNNTLKGNNGNDLLYGQNGNDRLYGGNNNDKLYGGNNNDKLYGGSGNDLLKGDAGNDLLQGDAGKDTMFGGAGADTFVFRSTTHSSASASGADIIRDFTRGVDKIDLHFIDASTKLSGNNAFTFDGTTSFGTSNQGDIYYKQFNNAGTSNDYTMVYIDTDNDSGTEMSIKLMGLHNLTASDFIL